MTPAPPPNVPRIAYVRLSREPAPCRVVTQLGSKADSEPNPDAKQDEPRVHAHPKNRRPTGQSSAAPDLVTDAAAHAGAEQQRRVGVVPLQEPQHVDLLQRHVLARVPQIVL